MSQTLVDLTSKALAVRDHYDELQRANGGKIWDVQDRMTGFVGDVGDLSKLIMAKHQLRQAPENIDAALAHELSDCLWSVLVIANELGVDLETAFTKNVGLLHDQIEVEKKEALV